MFFISKTNYEKSNKITSVKIHQSSEAIFLSQQILKLADARSRQDLGEKLLDELCDLTKIDIVKLNISDENQHHQKRNGKLVMKRYGQYQPGKNKIEIQNRTAVRGQILAPKTLLDTLLHEWLHHYDTCHLKLNSIHTKGFYLRLNDLKEKLEIL